MSDRKEVVLDRGWGIVLRDLKIQADNVLRRANLARDLLARPQARLTVEEYFRFWKALEAEADEPTLPIRLGIASTPETFHPAIFAALCSPDLRTAVKRIAEYKRLIAPVRLIVEDDSRGLSVSKRWDAPVGAVPPALGATELVFLTQIARIGTRERIRPLRVEGPHPMTPREDFEDFFGVTPLSSERLAVTFRPTDASRPFLTASETVWQAFEPELRRGLDEHEASASIAERIRSVLLESLPSGDSSIEITSRRLGLSARTVQRRLNQSGTSYKQLVKDTRKQLAHHYLANSDLSYAEIGFLLGYAEPSSFFRAFRSWTGETPDRVRHSPRGS
ncbi:MAG: AraC family transcriptional regulator ligand-binding domain-containing protein [Acidobacteriota bacterium]